MKKFVQTAFAAAAFVAALQASATTLTFENLVEGATLSDQYVAFGATFSLDGFTGSGNPTPGVLWATNTDMTITSSDLGGTGLPSLVSGNVLHSFKGWLSDNGDPNFRVSFSGNGVTSFSADFAGVASAADAANVRLFVYDGDTLLSTVAGSTSGQFTLSTSAAKITSIVVTPGSYLDWVAVDNISFTLAAVPEPETWALMGLGLGVIALARRRATVAA